MDAASVLKEWRDSSRRNTYQRLADESGVHENTIRQIGDRTPKPSTVERLARVLGEPHATRLREVVEAQRPKTARPHPRPRKGSPLQLFIYDAMEALDWPSYRTVAKQSGGRMTASNLSRIITGKGVKLRPETVEGLAGALQVEPGTLREAIAQTEGGITYELPLKAKTLSPEGWDQVLKFIDYVHTMEKRPER